MAACLLSLLPLLMAGGLTRKQRPSLQVGVLWTAAGLDALALLGFVALGGTAYLFTIPGEVLAVWVPPLARLLGMAPFDNRMLLKDGVGALLPPLAFTLGYLLARQPEKGEEAETWSGS